MDVNAFALAASQAGVGNVMPFFPGNAEPRIETPKFSDPTKQNTIGEGVKPTSWVKYLEKAVQAAAYPFTAPIALGHSALKEVAGASGRATSVFTKASDAAVAAATGISTWTKWLVVGIIAVAVIYILSIFSPVLRRVQGA